MPSLLYGLVLYVRNITRRFTKVTVSAVMFVLAAAVITTVALYAFKMFWFVFADTGIGRRYVIYFPGKAAAIYEFLRIDLIFLAARLTAISFAVCLAISSFCQILHISRIFFLGRGLLFSIVFWGLPLTAATAFFFQPYYGLAWNTAYLTALVPTLCLFLPCFSYSRELLPEIGEVINSIGVMIYSRLPNRWRWVISDMDYELVTVKHVITLTLITGVLNTGLLVVGQKFWPVFTAGQAGFWFTYEFPQLTGILSDILSRDVVHLSIRVTLVTVFISLMFGAVCQVLHALRKLYIPRGFMGRILFWALPMAALAATAVKHSFILPQWQTAFVAVMLPTLLIHASCLNCMYIVLPEAGEMLKKLSE